ncbi:MAG: lipoyl synthase [Gaiellales bacterium]|nr:lipoyl synthase [Gaiellales bacterium]
MTPDPLRKPPWLKKKLPRAEALADMTRLLRGHGLHTVCERAACPNRGECFERGTATFLILGDHCTRNCRFCAVPPGHPGPPDPEEPHRVAHAAVSLGLRHVVITSVTRDDLSDGGASHFVACMQAVRRALPEASLEVLVPDFQGEAAAVDVVLAARPEVFNHNVETIPEFYALARPQAIYARSLQVLRRAAGRRASVVKSGFMVGLGEDASQVHRLLEDLRGAGVQVVTIGQYLRPSKDHLEVVEYVPPEVFAGYRQWGEALGLVVEAGPFVRSSYLAEAGFARARGLSAPGD